MERVQPENEPKLGQADKQCGSSEINVAVDELRMANSNLAQSIGHKLVINSVLDYHILRFNYPSYDRLISIAMLWYFRVHNIKGHSKLAALNK